jgi:hypothetical protein
MMDTMIQIAAESRGKTYLDVEHELMRNNPTTIYVLQQNRNHPDPVIRLMVSCLLSWISGKVPEYQAVLDYLDEVPKRVARTPARVPAPESVAFVLNERFGSRVADFLALRLVKEPNWPRWRVTGILLYLKEQKLPSTVSVLLRYITETESDESRVYALETVQAIADPQLQSKLLMERERLNTKYKDLDKVLQSLAPR